MILTRDRNNMSAESAAVFHRKRGSIVRLSLFFCTRYSLNGEPCFRPGSYVMSATFQAHYECGYFVQYCWEFDERALRPVCQNPQWS